MGVPPRAGEGPAKEKHSPKKVAVGGSEGEAKKMKLYVEERRGYPEPCPAC